MAQTASNHKNCVPYQEALPLMKLPKSYNKNVAWRKGTNVHWRLWEFIPNDRAELPGTIAGMSVQVRVNVSRRFKQSKLLFTLFKVEKQQKSRLYQLETDNENKVTSCDNGTNIHGVHEHIGDKVNKLDPLFEVDALKEWFVHFCTQITLEYTGGELCQPMEIVNND